MNERRIRVRVNGELYERTVDVRRLLADFLRDELGLTGTHLGCEHGVCGACTIVVNGAAVRSCLLFAVQVDAAEILTVEGLADGERLHPLRQAFWESHGLQCGFCTPGFLMSVSELLERSPDPSDEDILDTLGGHICRCTGYQAIVEAVKLAAKKVAAARAAKA